MEDFSAHRRHHEQPKNDKLLKTRNLLNAAFMILAVIGLIIYFAANETVGTIVILVGMTFKIVECCIRMIYK
ncbi:MAG: hypothetical protein IJM81_03785 [Prevotella sp.]|nr:hypothetical protein [Prevotella sp.]